MHHNFCRYRSARFHFMFHNFMQNIQNATNNKSKQLTVLPIEASMLKATCYIVPLGKKEIKIEDLSLFFAEGGFKQWNLLECIIRIQRKQKNRVSNFCFCLNIFLRMKHILRNIKHLWTCVCYHLFFKALKDLSTSANFLWSFNSFIY